MPPLRPPEISGRASERPRDHATHAIRSIQKFSRDLAHLVKFRHRNYVLVRRNLKDAVARRVYDRKTGPHMLLVELFDYFRAGRRLVPYRAPPDLLFKFRDQLRRKSVRINRKRLSEKDPSHFPVAGGGVFSRRVSGRFAETSRRFLRRVEMREPPDIRKPEPHQIRQLQWPRARDVAERVASHVAVVRSVRQFADPHAIQHDPDHTPKWLTALSQEKMSSAPEFITSVPA